MPVPYEVIALRQGDAEAVVVGGLAAFPGADVDVVCSTNAVAATAAATATAIPPRRSLLRPRRRPRPESPAGLGPGVAAVNSPGAGGSSAVDSPHHAVWRARSVCSAVGRSSGSLLRSASTIGSSGPACFMGSSGSTAMAYAVSIAVARRKGGRPSTAW